MTNNKITLLLAKRDDINFFYSPEERKLDMRGWVLKRGEDRLAIGGVWFGKGKNPTAFVKTMPDLPIKTFWDCCLFAANQLKHLNYNIVAIRDEGVPSSKRFLEKLGFRFHNIQDNQEIYKLWQQ